MKKIFLLGVCLAVSTVFAQGLFPELEGFDSDKNTVTKAPPQQQKKEEVLPPIIQEPVDAVKEKGDEVFDQKTEVDLFTAEQKAPEETTPTVEENTATEEADEGVDSEEPAQIQIYSDNVDATITPNRNFSYCFGSIKFYNGLRRPIQNLVVVLTYGDLETKYSIRNLAPRKTQTEKITLVGTACEQLMDMPKVDVQKCQVPDMEENTCKKRVSFVPLR